MRFIYGRIVLFSAIELLAVGYGATEIQSDPFFNTFYGRDFDTPLPCAPPPKKRWLTDLCTLPRGAPNKKNRGPPSCEGSVHGRINAVYV